MTDPHDNFTTEPLSLEARAVRDAALPSLLDELARTKARRSRTRAVVRAALVLVAAAGITTIAVLRPGPVSTVPAPAQHAQTPAPAMQPEEAAPVAPSFSIARITVPPGTRAHVRPIVVDPAVSPIERIDRARTRIARIDVSSGDRSPVVRLSDQEFIAIAAAMGQTVGVARVGTDTIAMGWEPRPLSP